MKTEQQLRGHWRLDIYEGDIEWERRSDGLLVRRNPLLQVIEDDNLVVTSGKSLLLDRLYNNGGAGGPVNSMGVGDDPAAAVVGQTKLNPVTAGNVFIQPFDSQATRAGLVETSICTYTTGQANFNWQELAEMNGTVNGTSAMFNRIAPIGPFNKTVAVSIVVTVTVTQS